MSGGIFYPVTRRDVHEAILLCDVMASNKTGSLWCGNGTPPLKQGEAPCGHSDDWFCAAEALGVSSDAVHLMIRASNLTCEAWADTEIRDEEALEVLAPRHVAQLFSDGLEAALLLRAGWLPSDYYIVRHHQKDRGEYIPLHWEYGAPDAYYVRGFVTVDEFKTAIGAYFGESVPKMERIRQCYAFWAFSGQDGYGNASRTLCETSSRKGTFAVTVMEACRE